ncbi:uncharacterized protein LOC114263572 [Camellia sinensis]|uniref:uncharacterized protein LOC114263572 n=1 Tax=Camellia sinensis TaxID=4442 RepID=UPI00103559D9|nr:uncharacterized protein LOC114263572 [Camellia sinensis]
MAAAGVEVVYDGFRAAVLEFFHFVCTSEDINNLAHALMLKEALNTVIFPVMDEVIKAVCDMAKANAHVPMFSRTHGQPASPTTLGKEIAIFAVRLSRERLDISQVEIMGKFAGAVGNNNAHLVAYHEIKWPQIAEEFVKSLGLSFNPYVTQVSVPCSKFLLTSVFIRFLYNFLQARIIPRNFIYTDQPSTTAAALCIKARERDLTDSTVLRNMGEGLGHSLLAYRSALQGISKLQVNEASLFEDLNESWEVLAEPIQTVLLTQLGTLELLQKTWKRCGIILLLVKSGANLGRNRGKVRFSHDAENRPYLSRVELRVRLNNMDLQNIYFLACIYRNWIF